MFDNLRDDSSFYEEEPNDLYQEPTPAAQAQPVVAARSSPRKRSARYMGMTAQQRFLLSVMLLITVCVMGVLTMVVTGRMGF
jgi:hypothetical protein